MSRKIGSSGPKTMEAIRKASLKLIYAHGYEAMTLRDLAREVGLQQGSLYNYFSTKQELLFMMVSDHMQTVLSELDRALEGKQTAFEKLKAFIVFHIDHHMARKYEVFVNYSELRSFTEDNYRTIVGMRKQYEQKLVDIISEAQEDKIICVHDAKITAYGILSMLTGICQWFQPDGRMSKDEIVTTYTTMALNALQAKEPDHKTEQSHATTTGVMLSEVEACSC